MCFNKETSIVVFVIGLASALELFRESFTNGIDGCIDGRIFVIGLIIFLVSLMQLNEYFLWSFSNKDEPESRPTDVKIAEENFIANLFVMFILFFQIILVFIANLYFKFIDVNSSNMFVKANSIACILFILVYFSISCYAMNLIMNVIPHEETLSYKDSNTCRMTWGHFLSVYNYDPSVFIAWMTFYSLSFITLIVLVPKNFLVIALLLLSFIGAIIYSAAVGESPDDVGPNIPSDVMTWNEGAFATVFGSTWCFVVMILVIGLIIFRGLDYPFKANYIPELFLKQKK